MPPQGVVRTSAELPADGTTAPRAGSSLRPALSTAPSAAIAARAPISSRIVRVHEEPPVLRPGERLVSEEEFVPPVQAGPNWNPSVGGEIDYSGPDWFAEEAPYTGEMVYDGGGYVVERAGPAGQGDPWYQPEDWLTEGQRHGRGGLLGCGMFCWDCLRNCRICPGWRWNQDLQFTFGADAFQGPLDLGMNGNFGYSGGVNYGIPLWHQNGIGAQLGAQVITSNFAGTFDDGSVPAGDRRTQVFVTGGIFRRLWHDTCGWQWGIAYDYLSDSYYENTNYAQVRLELSHRFWKHEFGVWGAYGAMEDDLTTAAPVVGTLDDSGVVSQTAFFWRYHFSAEAEGRLWGGFTDGGDGIAGADARVALSKWSQLQTYCNYLAPTDSESDNSVLTESWNIGFRLILFPAGTARPSMRSRYRPLFDVANNGTFFVDR